MNIETHWSVIPNFAEKHPAEWSRIESCLLDLDFPHVCHIADEISAVSIRMKLDDIKTDDLKYDVDDLVGIDNDDLVKDINERLTRPYGKHRKLIQSIFDHYKLMGEWPISRRLGVEMRGLGDLFEIGKNIGPQIVNVGNGYDTEAISTLSILGISLCNGSESIQTQYLRIIKYLVDWYIENTELPLIESEELVEAGIFESGEEAFIYDLIQGVPNIANASAHSENKSKFSLTISHDILQYEHVKTMDEFLKLAYPDRYKLPASDVETDILPFELVEYVESGVTATRKKTKEIQQYDVFISYSSKNKTIANKIYQAFEKNRINAFMAPHSINSASRGPDEIKYALKNSTEVLFLMTPHSIESNWVLTEWGAAWVLDKPATPMLYKCKIKDVPVLLNDWQKREYPADLNDYVAEVLGRIKKNALTLANL